MASYQHAGIMAEFIYESKIYSDFTSTITKFYKDMFKKFYKNLQYFSKKF